jgi:hypothetical protein
MCSFGLWPEANPRWYEAVSFTAMLEKTENRDRFGVFSASGLGFYM